MTLLKLQDLKGKAKALASGTILIMMMTPQKSVPAEEIEAYADKHKLRFRRDGRINPLA